MIFFQQSFRSSNKDLKETFHRFKVMDLDRNRYIELNEALAFFNSTLEVNEQWFLNMDINNDGKISPQEFDDDLAYMERFDEV